MAAAALVLAILCAPSLWMLRAVPPLWKDIDAYLQVTEPPNVPTILQYAPLYCFSARLPLYVGYAYDCVRAGSSLPSLHFFAEPILTNSGVSALLLLQHAAIWIASYLAISAATRLWLLRITLAAMWAVNPLLYIVAQTVGSEALSAILLLLIGATALALMQRAKSVRLWIAFGLLFGLSMLTRHINGVVAALLPLAFGASALLRVTRRRGQWLREARYALIAIAASVVAIGLADVTFRIASDAAGIPYHRRIGFSFLFRLNFLADLPPREREPLLNRAAAHAKSRWVRCELDALREIPASGSQFDAMALLDRIYARLPEEVRRSIGKTDEVLNETARAFLVAPSKPYLKAVAADIAESQGTTITDIVGQLLKSTTVYFDDPAKMPKCASLVTFRATDPREFLSHIYKGRYFAAWKRCPHLRLLLITVGALIFVVGRARSRTVGCALALLVVGFLSV
ncbi:MAG: hypothetical protein ACJ8JD_05695, partial [Chthoniobacterales bacterium]